MGNKVLTHTSAPDKLGMRMSMLSPQTKGKRRKPLVRQHRKQSFEAAQTESPQAESPWSIPILDAKELPSIQYDMPNQLTTNAPTNNEIDDADRQNERTKTPIPRRFRFFPWFNRTFAVSNVRDIPLASTLLTCQPSSYFIGSLNGTISEMHLPLLTELTKARIGALKAVRKQCHLEVKIENVDELPFGAYSHPQVHVHVVDRCTGRVLCPSQMTREATFSSRFGDKSINAFEWQQALSFSVDMPAFLNTRTVLLFEILEAKDTAKGLHFRRDKEFESVSTRDEDEEYQRSSQMKSKPDYRKIAWGFFHTITTQGTPTIDSFDLLNGSDVREKNQVNLSYKPCELRVRLFQFQVMSWLDNYQAKLQWGWRKTHLTMPAVFLQYQKRSRVPAPCTLHIQLRAVSTIANQLESNVTETTGALKGRESCNSDIQKTITGSNDAQFEPGESDKPLSEGNSASPDFTIRTATSDTLPSEIFDLIAPCKRNIFELCLIPHRVICSFPAGRKGCSAINFSPCGRFLAASASFELGDFVVQVYHLASAELFSVGRGHRGIIYSLEWSLSSSGQYRLLSASSDGTVRLWKLPHMSIHSIGSGRNQLLSLIALWQHFPSFVYCAIFLPESNGEIMLSGASDGYLRFRRESLEPNSQLEYGNVLVSSAAVHSICVEAKSGRIFCGDAKGDITVWRRSASASTLSDYERIKTIQTGQAKITSLKLHPRKAHLLVHTQPNAIFQYELRSYLLLNKSYAGVVCESLLVKSTFSPDGKFVISGSEDGVPRIFTSLYGQQVQRGVWGTHFFHDCPVLDVSWSPTAHVAALCSYGGNNPIVVLCAYRGDEEAVYVDGSTSNARISPLKNFQLAADAFRETNQLEALNGDHARRYQQALERRQKRFLAKLTLEAKASKEQGCTSPT